MQYTFNVSIKVAIFLDSFTLIYKQNYGNKQKNQMSIISDEGINRALKAFKLAYKENKEAYEKEKVNPEDVENLTKSFSKKSALLATTVIISVMIAMPPKEFMALIETAKSVTKAKFLELMKEVLKDKAEGADNDIDK